MRAVDYRCPHDDHPLAQEAEALRCHGCGRAYPIESGVAQFLEQEDDFYEDHYARWLPGGYVPKSERWYHAWPLWLVKSGYLWAIRRHVPSDGTLLELGCGSGVTYLGQRFRTIGVDVAQSGLVKAARLYDGCLRADITRRLPVGAESVDGIAHSFLWEHLPPEVKPRALEEWFRVLRPGGSLIMLYDVETENPLLRRLRRRDPDRYRELYIEREHHYGYQTPAANRALFEQAGFRLLAHRGNEKTWIQSPSEYARISQWPGWPRYLRPLGTWLSRPPLVYAYTALVRVIDVTLGAPLPSDWARTVLAVCQKPDTVPAS